MRKTRNEKITDDRRAIAVRSMIKNPEERGDELTSDAAAEFIGISVATLRNYCSRGMIPYYRRGRRSFFYTNELKKHRILSTVAGVR